MGRGAGTAYIITRDYARVLVNTYCLGEKRFHLEIPGTENVLTPLLENVLFETLEDVCYSIPLFVEDISFNTTFSTKEDSDISGGQKSNHIKSHNTVINYWKNRMKSSKGMTQIEILLQHEHHLVLLFLKTLLSVSEKVLLYNRQTHQMFF